MERVHGIGGCFFRSRAPKALAAGYAEHLGVGLTPPDDEHPPWRQEAAPAAREES